MPNHILIVDDEPGILDTLSGILQDERYEVSVAKGGQDALKLIKSDSPPDLVLLDIWMPDLDGIETLQRAMEAHPRLLVIMMSGHGSIESAVKAIKLGAYDFIEKPLSLDKVTLLVRHALHERRRARVAPAAAPPGRRSRRRHGGRRGRAHGPPARRDPRRARLRARSGRPLHR